MRDLERSLRPDATNPVIIAVPDRLAAYRLSEVTKTVQNCKCIEGRQLNMMLPDHQIQEVVLLGET